MKVCILREENNLIAVFPEIHTVFGEIVTYTLRFEYSNKSLEYIYNLEECRFEDLSNKIALFKSLQNILPSFTLDIVSKADIFNYEKILLECEELENQSFEHFELKDMERTTELLKTYSFKYDYLEGIRSVFEKNEEDKKYLDALAEKTVAPPRYQSSPLYEAFCNYMNQICLEYSFTYQR